jgi:aquaporin Z
MEAQVATEVRAAAAGSGRAMLAHAAPRRGIHLAEWLAELAGTGLLLLGGLSAICLVMAPQSWFAGAVPDQSWRLLITGALFAGSGLAVTLSPIGRLSGAHLNPAVTLAFWITRHVHPGDVAGYVVAQTAGAIAGAGLARILWGDRFLAVNGGITRPGHGMGQWQALLIETGITAILVGVIFAGVSSPRTARLTPFMVWATVTVLVWQVAPYTGTSLNPARSLASAVAMGSFDALAPYLAGPLLGAALVGAAARVAGAEARMVTAKLFHDQRFPTVFRSRLPSAMPG